MANKKANKIKPTPGEEPTNDHSKNRISFFSSLKEQEIENYKWLASLTPEENLYHATQLIKRVFAKELAQYPIIGNRVKFGN